MLFIIYKVCKNDDIRELYFFVCDVWGGWLWRVRAVCPSVCVSPSCGGVVQGSV